MYLYFLGIWLYDNLPQLPHAIGLKCEKFKLDDPDEYFLLQWAYASLLHDVGYAFHNLKLETQEDRRLIDKIYSWEFVRKHTSELSKIAESAFQKVHDRWNREYGTKMRPGTAEYAEGSNELVMERLAEAPWLGDLDDSFRGKDIFEILDSEGTGLREYAREVATNGYGGGGACVDHAIASGLLLFQYTSFWYWLMRHLCLSSSGEIHKEVAKSFDYSLKNITTDFIPACRSIAYHNIQINTNTGKDIAKNITLKKDPITWLSILCDELQRWDRYPAGSTHLDDYRLFSASALESSDISLTCDGPRDHPHASFVFRARNRAETIRKLCQDLRSTLSERVPEFSEILKLIVL